MVYTFLYSLLILMMNEKRKRVFSTIGIIESNYNILTHIPTSLYIYIYICSLKIELKINPQRKKVSIRIIVKFPSRRQHQLMQKVSYLTKHR